MNVRGKVVVVTGGGSGIGRALCVRFAAEGARGIVIADLNEAAATEVAEQIGGRALRTDVAREQDVLGLVAAVVHEFGSIDLFCSNAGIFTAGGETCPNGEWQRIWEINVMAHVYAARALIPLMVARGEGYLLNTASAAGLLTQLGSAPYAVTKHAAVAFAEWLSTTYGHLGIRVSCLCPQGVRTPMLDPGDLGIGAFLAENALSPEAVAEAVVRGLEAERFLILPHPEVHEYAIHRAQDHDRWIRGMRRLGEKVGLLSPAPDRPA